VTRTDALLAAITAEVEARRAQIDGVEDLRRAELIFVFDDRSGDPLDVLFRTESWRRIARQHDPARGTLAAMPRR
jgi:hypothetical protein